MSGGVCKESDCGWGNQTTQGTGQEMSRDRGPEVWIGGIGEVSLF